MNGLSEAARRAHMRRAIALSIEKSAALEGGPFGCVIARVSDDAVVGEGWNRVTTANDPTAHAEIVAVRAACAALNSFQLSGCEVFASCEPCPMCLGALYWARVDRIFYANTREDAAAIDFSDDFLYRELTLPLDKRAIPITGLMRAQAQEAFELWRTLPGKVAY